MQTIIYLCRHGDVHNPDQRIYGQLPGFPLSALGRKQAHKLGKHLSIRKLAAIYASPLARTHETATIVGSYHGITEIICDDRLLEVHSPAWEGKPIAAFELLRWDFYKPEYLVYGGESLNDIWKRMHSALTDIAKKHKGQEVAVFSHGDPIMTIKVKHEVGMLTLNRVRRQDYIQTARGFELIIEGKRVKTMRPLVF